MQEIKYQGKYMSVTEEIINNHMYERVQLREGVHVLPVRDDKILFMKEYRPHEDAARWKLVSGWCDKEGMSPLEHAKEEFAEEIGMQAVYWEEIFNTVQPKATINMNTYYFICKDISELEVKIKNPDIGAEVLDSKWFSFEDIFMLIEKGEMWPDTSAITAILYLYNFKK